MDRFIQIAASKSDRQNIQRQSGVVLLLFLLLMEGVAASLLVHKLSAGLLFAVREHRTAAALNQAREALIGYAVSYPDTINSDYGPGYLPCPDRNNDGATDPGGCSLSGQTSIGRLPYKTLEIEHLRDGQGETLWYIVADNFRNNPKLEPLNSDTAGNLSVDAMNNIAVIVIAPGPPVLSQNRKSGPDNVANYLESENADFDTHFVTHAAGVSNDQLVFITREELMQAVERRVLGEVSQRLRHYQLTHHAFPWLSPFDNPAVSDFRAQLDTDTTPKKGWQGHIAFHPFSWTTKPAKMTGANPFTTDILWNWANINNSVINSSGTVDASCVMQLNCAIGTFQNITGLASSAPVPCIWTDRETVDCAEASVTRTASYTYPLANSCAAGTLTRTYTINFPSFQGMVTVQDPTPTSYRTRDVVLNGALPAQANAVQITDVYSGPVSAACDYDTVIAGTGSMSFMSGTTGIISSLNMHYDLDVKAGEMPEWFFKNDWHTMIYVAYAEAELTPGSTAHVCNAAENCLYLNEAGSPLDKNRALVLVAGRALPGQLRPAVQLSAYFESTNAIVDENFLQGVITPAFNDQAKVIATP